MFDDILIWLTFLKFATAGAHANRAALHDNTARRSAELTIKLPDIVDALYNVRRGVGVQFEKHSEALWGKEGKEGKDFLFLCC